MNNMIEALERIAAYPSNRSEEMSIETAREIARAALASQTQQEPTKAANLFEIVTHGESGDAWLLLRADVNLGLGHHCIKFDGAAADDLRKRFKVMGSMQSQAQQDDYASHDTVEHHKWLKKLRLIMLTRTI